MTVDAIKEAIAGLPEEERHSLAESDEWDSEMVRDFAPGSRGHICSKR